MLTFGQKNISAISDLVAHSRVLVVQGLVSFRDHFAAREMLWRNAVKPEDCHIW